MSDIVRFVGLGVVVVCLTLPARADSYWQLLLHHTHCGERQSCIPVPQNMSFIMAETVKMSVAPLPSVSDVASCTKGFFSAPIADTIRVCETYLKNGNGSVRDRARVMFTLGHAYMRVAGTFDNPADAGESKSIRIWDEAARLDPAYIEPLLSSGKMYGYSGQLAKAQAAFDQAEKIDPRDWRIFTSRAVAFQAAGVRAGALEAADKAVKIAPFDPEVRQVHGMVLLSWQRYDEAAADYKFAALHYQPSPGSSLELMQVENPWISLANVYKMAGKPLLAAEAITNYIDKLPPQIHDFQLYQWRAEYFELAGLYGKAAEDLRLASLQAPRDFVDGLMAKRALLLAQSGATTEAREDLHRLLEQGNLKATLKVQVFLKNQGYNDVKINGHYDAETQHALDTCLQDKACAPGVGQAI